MRKPRPLLGTVVYNSLGNLSMPISSLVTGPLLARALGPEGRGLMAALLVPVSLANLIFTLGVPESITYFVARRRLHVRTAVKIALTGGLACGCAAIGVLFIVAPILLKEQANYVAGLRLLSLTLPVTLAFAALRGIAQGRYHFDSIIGERITAALLRLLVLTMLMIFGLLDPVTAVWVSVLSGAAGSIVLLTALRPKEGEPPSTAGARDVARYASAVALGTFGDLLMVRLDQTLMVSLTSHAQLGYYTVAATLAEVPLTVVLTIRDLAFTISAERGDPKVVARLCRVTFLLASVMCGIVGLAAPMVLPLLFGRKFGPSTPMAQALLVAAIGTAVTGVAGAGLMTSGKMWLRSLIQLSGAALTACLLVAVVPRWGGIGAAWVAMATSAVTALASLAAYSAAAGVSMRECVVPTRADLANLRIRQWMGWNIRT